MGLFKPKRKEGEYLRKARQNKARHLYNANSYGRNKKKYKADAKKRPGAWPGFF